MWNNETRVTPTKRAPAKKQMVPPRSLQYSGSKWQAASSAPIQSEASGYGGYYVAIKWPLDNRHYTRVAIACRRTT